MTAVNDWDWMRIFYGNQNKTNHFHSIQIGVSIVADLCGLLLSHLLLWLLLFILPLSFDIHNRHFLHSFLQVFVFF